MWDDSQCVRPIIDGQYGCGVPDLVEDLVSDFARQVVEADWHVEVYMETRLAVD